MLTSRFPRLLRAGARRVDELPNYRADGSADPTKAAFTRICGANVALVSGPGHRLVAALGVDADQERRHRCIGAVEDRSGGGWLDRDEGARRRGMILAVQPHRRLAFEHDVELDLAALGLVVLGDLP